MNITKKKKKKKKKNQKKKKKKTLTDKENKLLDTSWGREQARDKIEVGGQDIQTIMCKINKLQGHIVQHREYSQHFIIT